MAESGEQQVAKAKEPTRQTAEQRLTTPAPESLVAAQAGESSVQRGHTPVQRLTMQPPESLIAAQAPESGTPSRDTVMDNLLEEEEAGRGSKFDSAFLTALQDPGNADKPLSEVWGVVENKFATENGVKPRPNPYLKNS